MSSFRTHPLGHVAETETAMIFFGNQDSSLEKVKEAFPDFEFVLIKQTHSDIVVDSSVTIAEMVEADAHVTDQPRRALCIRTADCMPIMIETRGHIAAVHAGWRGVENEILLNACEKLGETSSAHAWVGPHIAFDSFEVGSDVAAKLEARFDVLRGWSKLKTVRKPHADPAKVYINLLGIALTQLSSFGIDEVSTLSINTLTATDHASYRRNGPGAGRNLSFIALK